MSNNNTSGKEPLRQTSPTDTMLPPRRPPGHVSDMSDVSQTYNSHGRQFVRSRESLASILTHNTASVRRQPTSDSDDDTYDGSDVPPPNNTRTKTNAAGYSPISPSATSPSRSSRLSRLGSRTSRKNTGLQEVQEEDIGLSLLNKASFMGTSGTHTPMPDDAEPTLDFTATLGPLSKMDQDFIKSLQREEARGTLTGGIGQGFKPGTSVRTDELLEMGSPTAEKRLSRTFSRRKSRRESRPDMIRELGQDEANRRGEIIEVITEEPASVDISHIEGPSTFSPVSRSATAVKNPATQVFYPQPNWRPFSMRAPWLAMLIFASFALAGMNEGLFQNYQSDAIVKFKSADEVSTAVYFAIRFAPTLAAVAYGVLWQFTDFEVRRLEAYYQLSKQEGALAAESINVDYVTSFSFWRPFYALKQRHYAVFLSSIATTLAVSLVPTFASASIILTPSRRERQSDLDIEKALVFSSAWSRLLTTTLICCGLAGCVLFHLLQTRRTGLLADVRGIAGLAAMAVVSHILMDFKDMDQAKHKDIHDRLKEHRYVLRNSSLSPDDTNPVTSQERDRYEDMPLSENPLPVMFRPSGNIPFLVGTLAFIAFIPVTLYTSASVITDKAPWVMTALAVLLKLAWHALDTATRMMEPFYRLSKRHAPSRTLTLDYTALPFGYMPVRALLNRHMLVFLVGFGTVMAEFLTILVTGLAAADASNFLIESGADEDEAISLARPASSGTETRQSFYVTLGIVIFILCYMFTVAATVFIRRRRPFLPRQPNTIVSVLAYIHQSKMLYNFVGTTKLSNTEMVQKLDDGKTYGLGWFYGRDGQIHCGVDEEELAKSYTHGARFLGGNQPWNSRWDVL